MQNLYFFIAIILLLSSCKDIQTSPSLNIDAELNHEVKYAKGFNIKYFDDYKTIQLTNPWPGSDKVFNYALVEKGKSLPNPDSFDAVIEVPVENIVVTSTTHIPSLEMLEETDALIGFPNLTYISSEKTRERIDKGAIVELGKNEDLNTEILIDLAPDLVVGFAVDGNNSTFTTLKNTGIPVVYNSDWTETTPLGKAEWIKFFGAFFNKEKEAEKLFNEIEAEYNLVKEIALKAKKEPTVLSGAMYKDIWYLPQGNSWAAQFINDANGDYLWKDTEGTGSLSLNLEAVLEKSQEADVWIGPGQFTSTRQMKDAHTVYSEFKAFKNGEVYNFTQKKGATGGVLYYELAPNRPDIVLKDIVKILHPQLLPKHELFFFSLVE